nr:MAG TPA: hypothetical protein [Caudoviricetes sp.]
MTKQKQKKRSGNAAPNLNTTYLLPALPSL